jgi:hypothetical protein
MIAQKKVRERRKSRIFVCIPCLTVTSILANASVFYLFTGED